MPNYCRREIDGKPCGQLIARVNALDWCNVCRARLPVWPTEAAEIEDDGEEIARICRAKGAQC